MSSPTKRVEKAEHEAAGWHSRLGRDHVSADAISEFFDWRKDPVNADAYRRIEQIWAGSSKLKGNADLEGALSAAMSRTAPKRRSRDAWVWRGAALAVMVAGCGIAFWQWTLTPDGYRTAV
ncbi:hypothetical protein LTR94_026874, partial [Friedmanniomyces endolithicus]